MSRSYTIKYTKPSCIRYPSASSMHQKITQNYQGLFHFTQFICSMHWPGKKHGKVIIKSSPFPIGILIMFISFFLSVFWVYSVGKNCKSTIPWRNLISFAPVFSSDFTTRHDFRCPQGRFLCVCPFFSRRWHFDYINSGTDCADIMSLSSNKKIKFWDHGFGYNIRPCWIHWRYNIGLSLFKTCYAKNLTNILYQHHFSLNSIYWIMYTAILGAVQQMKWKSLTTTLEEKDQQPKDEGLRSSRKFAQYLLHVGLWNIIPQLYDRPRAQGMEAAAWVYNHVWPAENNHNTISTRELPSPSSHVTPVKNLIDSNILRAH